MIQSGHEQVVVVPRRRYGDGRVRASPEHEGEVGADVVLKNWSLPNSEVRMGLSTRPAAVDASLVTETHGLPDRVGSFSAYFFAG